MGANDFKEYLFIGGPMHNTVLGLLHHVSSFSFYAKDDAPSRGYVEWSDSEPVSTTAHQYVKRSFVYYAPDGAKTVNVMLWDHGDLEEREKLARIDLNRYLCDQFAPTVHNKEVE